jgi:uncharacterized protein (DUF1778 family)
LVIVGEERLTEIPPLHRSSGPGSLIERAATLPGTTVTEFVVRSAQEAATNTIKDFEVFHLREEARDVFVNAVLKPPAPNAAARRAAEHYKNQMRL